MEAFSRRALGTSAVYGVLSIIFCLPLFSQPAGLSTADWGLHFTYYSHVLRSLVEYRQLPFWNPWSCGGNVLWQQPLVALLSPAYLLSAIVPLALAMKITIVFHYWLAFVGMHLLLTRVIGLSVLPLVIYIASVFTLAGALALHLSVGHLHFLPAFYLPLQLYFVCRALRTGALRPALGAAAILALTIYNGGLHLLPIELLSVGGLATCLAVARRDWRPLLIALAVVACGAAYAAPRLVPIERLVTSERAVDTADSIDHPDRMTPAMLWRAYTDSSLNADSPRFDVQRHGWWEYGNYIGLLAAFCTCLSIAWPFVSASTPQRSFAIALALMAVWFLILSAGEFHPFAPALALTHVPLVPDFHVPSRYTIPFVLFGTLAMGAAAQSAVDRLLTTRRRQIVLAVACVIAVAQLVIVNQRALRTTRSQLAGPGLSADNCREPLQLIRSADDQHRLVWSDGPARIVSIEATPNRVEVAVIGGYGPSKLFLNQNYAPGWRSTAGPVLVDSGGRMYVQLAAGQTGRFSFSFVPPGLIAGIMLLVVALVPSALVWNRRLSFMAIRSDAARREIVTTRFTDRAEQATKILVLLSIAAAVMTRAFVAGGNRTAFAVIAAGSFAVAWALSARWEQTVGIVLATTFVTPAVFARFLVYDANAYSLVLTGGLLGAMWPRWSRRHWSLPAEWRVPLVGWALTAAVAWPITAVREIDFHPEIPGLLDLPVSALGISGRGAISIAADAAILLMLGILWLDWLFERYAADRSRFRRMLVIPFLIGGSIACAVAAYQLFGDITFVNTGWADFHRASATMMDANGFGMVAVLCSCGFLAAMDSRRGRWDALMLGGFALSLIGTWASGSKTALVAEMIVIGVAVESVARHSHPAALSPGRRRRLSVLAFTAATAGVLLFAFRNTGPALRLGWILPDASVESVAGFTKMLWDRAGYGRAAIEMIRSSPWFGVGIGSFPVIVGDYPFSHYGGPLAPDNAQNWIRHNLAELGTIGSLGWMVWAAIVVTAVVRRPRGPRDRRDTIVAGALVGIVVISQFGMPTQSALVAIAFWMFLFWYFSSRRLAAAAPDRRSVASWQWILMTGWIIVFGIGTLRASLTTLRPPVRARHAGWSYVYGFWGREVTPSGEEYRRTAQHAVVVMPAATRVATLTVWAMRPDVHAHPVIARVWHDQRLVIDTVLRDNRPISADIIIDGDPMWLMVRTYLDRTLRESWPDSLAIQWRFLDTPPTESGAAIR